MRHSIVKAMQANEMAYMESIGKHDRQGVMEALAREGEGAALRLCFGPTAQEMPIRALSYAAAAIEIHARYFPKAQLQIVHPLIAGEAINGVPRDESILRAQELRQALGRISKGQSPAGRIAALVDVAPPDADTVEKTRTVLSVYPKVGRLFEGASANHGGDYAAYVAAHVLMHDTDPGLQPLEGSDTEAVHVERVISIGAQSERSFYLARMACKDTGLMTMPVETGQIFTKHVLAPYFQCREGEPLLSDGLEALDQATDCHPVLSVRRDLAFLHEVTNSSVSEREHGGRS